MEQPVVLGIQVFASFTSDPVAQTGIIPLPNPNVEEWLGGHAVVVVGYDDAKGMVLLKNSWGALWGQNGYGMLPYEYLQPARRLLMDAWSGSA